MEVGDEISKRNEVGVLVRAKEREGAITLSWLEKNPFFHSNAERVKS